MTTETDTFDLIDLDLDFDPPCEGRRGTCGAVAVWIGVSNCPCRTMVLGCDPCKRQTQAAHESGGRRYHPACGTIHDPPGLAIKWTPLRGTS